LKWEVESRSSGFIRLALIIVEFLLMSAWQCGKAFV
jgi:hypothetical protein